MNVILSGGGSGEQTKELDNLFASLLNKDKPLLYIPIAIDNIRFSYDNCLKWLKSTFKSLGIKQYKMITEMNFSDLSKINVEDYSGIYIGGGNTPYLLKKLKASNFWNKIKYAIKKNIPIYGSSAGAIIFSRSIKPSLNFDNNWVELKELRGMNIINDNYLFCHFSHEKEEQIRKIIINERMISSIALTEKNGLFITENEIKVVGQESAWIFNKKGNKKELKIGEKIKINRHLF